MVFGYLFGFVMVLFEFSLEVFVWILVVSFLGFS